MVNREPHRLVQSPAPAAARSIDEVLSRMIQKVGFIGLGNVGGKLARSVLRNGYELTVLDLDRKMAQPLLDEGAKWANTPKEMAEQVDVVATCLPSPQICSDTVESSDGLIHGLSKGKVWIEMSTTIDSEVKRLGHLVQDRTGAFAMDTPVSGGCHRAATGNIAILAGGEREAFEKVLPVLSTMGRRILHTGELGSASVLKVVTNFLASVHLAASCEALMVCKEAGMDLNVAYEAIKISSGNSFSHETESQIILNGSRDINFTMDLVVKDVSIFDELSKKHNIPLELSPLIRSIFEDGVKKYGPRELSPNIIKRLEDVVGSQVLAPGFPADLIDTEPEVPGYEVVINNREPSESAEMIR